MNQSEGVLHLMQHVLCWQKYIYTWKNYQEVINELTSVVADINAKRNLSLVPMPQTFPNNLKTSKDITFCSPVSERWCRRIRSSE